MKTSTSLSVTLVLVAFALGACGPKATPVTSVPASAEEAASLKTGLLGHWSCTHTKVGDGAKQTQPVKVEMTFNPDGTYQHVIASPFLNLHKSYTFALEGKNLKTNSPHGTYRIDAVAANTLELFNYDASTTWYYSR